MHYILDDNENAIPCHDLLEWATWLSAHNRTIEKNDTDNGCVSTVFLGGDHSFGGGEPVLFETMVFGGSMDQYQERYHTAQEARAGHSEILNRVMKENE